MSINYELIWKKVINLPWCTLVASGRTGSDAFQSQLDSHPEIYLIPGSIYLPTFWKDSVCASFEGNLDAGDIADEFIGNHMKIFKTKYDQEEKRGNLGENMDQSIDILNPVFRKHLVALLSAKPLTSRYFFQAVYVAYALSAGQNINIKKLFFDHVHHVRKVPDIIADFPDCKIICMTRDPRAAYVSGVEHWRRHSNQAKTPSFPLSILKRILDEPRPLAAYGENFQVMRLEDLDDERVMRKVCEWLDISFQKEVMMSTWNGLRWWGDTLSDIKPTKVMNESEFTKIIRNNNWEEKLNTLDKYVLNYLLYYRLQQCGYTHEIKTGMLTFLSVVAFIFFPTTYELRDFSPRNCGALILRRQFRQLLRFPYNYVRRVSYYFQLLKRRLKGENFVLPLLQDR